MPKKASSKSVARKPAAAKALKRPATTVAASKFAKTGPRRVIFDSPLKPKRLSEADLTRMIAKVIF